MNDQRTLVFLGCGNMGAAIIGGVVKSIPDARIIAIDPDMERARSLLPAGAQVKVLGSVDDIDADRIDLVVLGVKPQVFKQLDRSVLDWLGQHTVASIMAGIPLGHLKATIGGDKVIRVMPNLPAVVGQGMTLGCAAPDLIASASGKLVATIFESVGKFAWVADEETFERANPVFSCGPGFIFAIAEQMTDAAKASGVPDELANLLVRQCFLGSAQMLVTDPRAARDMKRAVTSPNGTTEAGLAQLEAPTGLPRIIPEAFGAAYARALELASDA